MLKTLLLLTSTAILLFANDKVHSFAKNKECKTCHSQIYNEFEGSMHTHSIPQKDPIHNAVWSKHPHNKKEQRYACGNCHTPAANNLDKMKTKGQKALPDINNTTHTDGIACAYCHRIQKIEKHKKFNINIISTEEKNYFGTRKEHAKSPFHKISTNSNKLMQNGNVCIGCHSHKANKFGLNVCSTNIANEMDGANCVSCHMPKVKGSVSDMTQRKTHAFHGFAGSHFHSDMLQKYVNISLLREIDDFIVNVDNQTSHALLLHPLRVAVLKVSINRAGKTIKLKDEIFLRVIGHDGKPAMPWKASTTLRDTMIKANEKRSVKYDFSLQKGDRVDVVLGWYLVNPKAVKKLNLQNTKIATDFIEFKKESFEF
ncbi:MAG: multiheme c-type cytochrome [Sulfurimonas sp.]